MTFATFKCECGNDGWVNYEESRVGIDLILKNMPCPECGKTYKTEFEDNTLKVVAINGN